jgi:epoxyqueuosine reductase
MALEEDLLQQARVLGFTLAGIARAGEADTFAQYREWLDEGFAGEMGYLHRNAEARRHPRSMMSEVRSVVMLGMQYASSPAEGNARLARYAHSTDYHEVLRERLKSLGQWLKQQRSHAKTRGVVDTAPLLERDFARRAGLGWFGKNTMLIHPRLGSWFLLAGLLTDLELQPTPSFETRHCGKCTACLDACPTEAFASPGRLDATKCISYLTIELRTPIPEPLEPQIGDWLFGCDICQEVCPWNRKAPMGSDPLAPRSELMRVDAAEVLLMSQESFAQRFANTALHPRPGRAVVARNAAIVLGNIGDASALSALTIALNDPEPMVAEAAERAIRRISARQ